MGQREGDLHSGRKARTEGSFLLATITNNFTVALMQGRARQCAATLGETNRDPVNLLPFSNHQQLKNTVRSSTISLTTFINSTHKSHNRRVMKSAKPINNRNIFQTSQTRSSQQTMNTLITLSTSEIGIDRGRSQTLPSITIRANLKRFLTNSNINLTRRIRTLLNSLTSSTSTRAQTQRKLAPSSFIKRARLNTSNTRLVLRRDTRQFSRLRLSILKRTTSIIITLSINHTITTTKFSSIKMRHTLRRRLSLLTTNTNLFRSLTLNLLRNTSRLLTSSLTLTLQLKSTYRNIRRIINNISNSRTSTNHNSRIILSLLSFTLTRRTIIRRRTNRLITSNLICRDNNRNKVGTTKRTTSRLNITSLLTSLLSLVLSGQKNVPIIKRHNTAIRRIFSGLLTGQKILSFQIPLRAVRLTKFIHRNNRKHTFNINRRFRTNQNLFSHRAITRPHNLLNKKINRSTNNIISNN